MVEEGEVLDDADPSPHKRRRPVRATPVSPRSGVGVATFDDLMAVASVALRSRMLPDYIKTVEQAFMILMTGADLGLRPSAALKYLYPTRSRRIALNTKGALAVVYQSKLCEAYKEWIEGKDEKLRAVATTRRRGMPDAFTKDFSWEDAKKAGLLEQRQTRDGEDYDSTYDKYLKDMLLSRARGRVLEIAYPDVLGGTPLEGIAEDIDRGEAEREGRPARPPVEDEPAGPRQITAGGPDPLLEALRGARKEVAPEPVRVEREGPHDAEILDGKAGGGREASPSREHEDDGAEQENLWE